MSKRRYTKKDFYSVIYLFHTSQDRRQKAISEKLNVHEGYVGKVLTHYLEKRMNLGEFAMESASRSIFVAKCLETNIC